MKKFRILLPFLAGFAATPAYAQDLGISPRIELRAGYDEVQPELSASNDAFTNRFGVGDFAFGAEAGIDFRPFPSVAIGAYAGIESSHVDGCVNRPLVPSAPTNRNDRVCVDAGQNFTVGVRAGIPIGNDGLIYAKGGYSRGGFSGYYELGGPTSGANPDVPRTQVFNVTESLDGYHFGGGVELNIMGGFYIKAEYVQHRYDELSNIGTNRFVPMRHQVMGGVGFRFGGGTR